MLRELYIENFALIDKLTLEFGPGLNVLTGETGAGKSIIVGAVGLLLGARASQEFLRSGYERAVITGAFDCDERMYRWLSELGITDAEEGVLLLSREISRSGKNICRVNGKMVTLSIFRELGTRLIDIYGQHEFQKIFSPDQQLVILDDFGGEELKRVKEDVARHFRLLNSLERKISEARRRKEEIREKKDFWEYQLGEIDSANLKEGEEEEIEKEIKILSGAEFLAQESLKAYSLLFDSQGELPSAYDLISEVLASLQEMRTYDPSLAEKVESLEETLYVIQDVADFLRNYSEGIEYDPQRLRQLEDRLSLINRIKNKYNKTIAEILQYRDEIAASLEDLHFSDDKLMEMENEREKVQEEYFKKAAKLSKLRASAGEELASEVVKGLKELEMKNVKFKVEIQPRKNPGEQGLEEVEFLFSANPGEPLRPLCKVASGGELSRLMLALKSVQAEMDSVPVLIFDEVDAGVGGYTAYKIGQKMAALAASHQVICVTHSPQVAAFSDAHFAIVKDVKRSRTITNVVRLSPDERIGEIARMLGGKEKETAVKHAKKLILDAKEYKA